MVGFVQLLGQICERRKPQNGRPSIMVCLKTADYSSTQPIVFCNIPKDQVQVIMKDFTHSDPIVDNGDLPSLLDPMWEYPKVMQTKVNTSDSESYEEKSVPNQVKHVKKPAKSIPGLLKSESVVEAIDTNHGIKPKVSLTAHSMLTRS